MAAWLLNAWVASAQPAGPPATNGAPEEAGATLRLANRTVCIFRATLDGYSPEERAAAVATRLQSVLASAKTTLVSTQAVPAGIQLSLDAKPLFVLTPADVSRVHGSTLELEATEAAEALRLALWERSSLATVQQVAFALGRAAFGFVLFAGLSWAARRVKRWLLAHSTRVAAQKSHKVVALGWRTASLRSFVAMTRAVLNFLSYLWVAFLIYALLWYELRCFPYTRPWGDYLRSQCLRLLGGFGQNLFGALPDFAVIVVIVLAARMLVQVVSRLFRPVEKGELTTRTLDPVTALTTRRLLVLLIWTVAAVVAYPYIPGSQTSAFKGVTVFAGLIISLGSTNLVNQFVSGLLLIYSRAFRVGDYVRVADTEGTVLGIGLCSTRIQTIKNEEVYIANSVLLGVSTKNFSQLAASEGLLLPVKVTIGYNAPWRQIHALLLEAARRTPGLARQPPPFVLQNSLSDFYVEYELNACLEKPERRVWVQSELQANIQDVFNEYGVQIMSPHYWHDPPKPHVVPKSEWFLPPATPIQPKNPSGHSN